MKKMSANSGIMKVSKNPTLVCASSKKRNIQINLADYTRKRVAPMENELVVIEEYEVLWQILRFTVM